MILTKKQLISTILLLALLISLPVAVYLSKKKQDIRPKASPVVVGNGSTLTFVGPSQVKAGEKFSIDLILDTTRDPQFTISQADALVSVSHDYTQPYPSCIPRPCAYLVVPPDFCQGGKIEYQKPASPCDCPPSPICIMPGDQNLTGQSQTETNKIDAGKKQEVTQQEMELKLPMPPIYRKEPISLTSISTGSIFDKYSVYPYAGGGIIPGEGCVGPGCPKLQPGASGGGSSQTTVTGAIGKSTSDIACTHDVKQCPDGSWVGRVLPRCEFAPCPGEPVKITPIPNPPYYGGNQFKISGSKNFAVDDKGIFKGFTGKGVFATLNFAAKYLGKVEIGFIPGTSIKGYLVSQPANSQEPIERLRSNAPNLSIEVVSDQTCLPRPACLDASPRCLLVEPIGGWCPPLKTTCTPYPAECLRDDTRCRIVDEPIGGWCNKEETFIGTIERLYGSENLADFRQWGEFQITTSDYGRPFPMGTENQKGIAVRYGVLPINLERAGDSKSVLQLREKMNKYVGQTVKLTGTLEYLDLEGGFSGIWAKDVETVNCIPPPDCSIMQKNTDGSEISICALMGAPVPGTVYCPVTPTPTPSLQCQGKPDGTFCGIGCENTPRCEGLRCYACDPIPGYCQNQICVSSLVSVTLPPGCSRKKEGDANCDGQIDGLDYSVWLNSQCNPGSNQKCGDTKGDFNGDGKVDDEDYNIWFNNRGKKNYLPD